jgi:hypothetical protein
LSTAVTPRQVRELPINGRNPLTLLNLIAGSNPTSSSINGQRTSSVNYTRDGLNVQDNFIRNGFVSDQPTVDDTGEFTVITQNAGAEYGSGSTQVVLVTPRGGSDFHGNVFAFNRNSRFAANNFFNNFNNVPRAFLNRNQFGGTLSGPSIFPNFGEGGPSVDRGKRSSSPTTKASASPTRCRLRPRRFCPRPATVTSLSWTTRRHPHRQRAERHGPEHRGHQRRRQHLQQRRRRAGGRSAHPEPHHQPVPTSGTARSPASTSFRPSTSTAATPRRATSSRAASTLILTTRIRSTSSSSATTSRTRARTSPPASPLTPSSARAARRRCSSPPTACRRPTRSPTRFAAATSALSLLQRDDQPARPALPADLPLVTNPEASFQSQGRNTDYYNIQDNATYARGNHSIRFGAQGQFYRIEALNDAGLTANFNIGSTANPATPGLTSANFPGGINSTDLARATQLALPARRHHRQRLAGDQRHQPDLRVPAERHFQPSTAVRELRGLRLRPVARDEHPDR